MINAGTFYSSKGAIDLNNVKAIGTDRNGATMVVYTDATQITFDVDVKKVMQFVKKTLGDKVQFED